MQEKIEKECTFHPKINDKSKTKTRKVNDLLKWDKKRQEKLHEMVEVEENRFKNNEFEMVSSESDCDSNTLVEGEKQNKVVKHGSDKSHISKLKSSKNIKQSKLAQVK